MASDTLNAYEVVVTYLEPTQLVIQMLAQDEEHARELITENFSELLQMEIQQISQVAADIPVADLNPNKTIN